MKQLKLEDFMTYRPLSRLTFAPGGARAAFVLTAVNEEKDGYDQSIWLYEDGGVRRLTGLGKEARLCPAKDANPSALPRLPHGGPEEEARRSARQSFTRLLPASTSGGRRGPCPPPSTPWPFAADGPQSRWADRPLGPSPAPSTPATRRPILLRPRPPSEGRWRSKSATNATDIDPRRIHCRQRPRTQRPK